MIYKFRYFEINQHFTHLATAKNFPEANIITEDSVPDFTECDIKRYPHCTGEWKEIDISFLTILWYRFAYGDDWRIYIEYELTGKMREKGEVRIGEIIKRHC